MAADRQRGVIVISEDAYKQNTVYRPWKDIVSGETERLAVALKTRAGSTTVPGARRGRKVG